VLTFENIPSVNTYQIRVQGTDGNTLDQVIERTHATLRTFRLHVVPGIEFGETYNISVRGFVNGTWDDYGTVCQVTTPQSTALIFTQCDNKISVNNEMVNFRAVAGANRYKVRMEGPNGYLQEREFTDKRFRMNQFPSIVNARVYTVSIAWSSDAGATWSDFGPSCELTTLYPIQLILDDCGGNFSSRNEIMRAVSVNGADNYRAFVTTNDGFASLREQATRNFRFSNVTGMVLGSTYNVQVSYQVNGLWANYGNTCQVHLFPSLLSQNNEASELMAEEFLSVFPNPNNGTFTVQTSNKSEVNVVNALGQTIHTFNASEEVSKVELNLAPGIYYVSTTINGQRLMERVVVQ
jgi:hypothetical protein